MNFQLNDEQRLLADSVGRLAQETGRTGEGHAASGQDAWSRFAGIGILGLPFAEADGGFGGGAVETMIVAEA